MSGPQGAGTPKRERRGASVERSLTEAREPHQKALAMVAALEEEIECLSCPLIRSQSEAQAHCQSRDCHRCRSSGWKRRHCQVQLEDCHAPYFKYHPSQRSLESKEDVVATEDLNLEELPELGLEVTCFLQGSAKSLEEENMKVPSPEPPIEKLQKWVTWKAWAYETPSWWQDLTMVPEVDDYDSWHMRYRPLFSSQREWVNSTGWKMTIRLHLNCHVFAGRISCHCQILSLACWISGKSSMRRQWHMPRPLSFGWRRLIHLLEVNHGLLVGSIMELQEEMKCYLSFSNEDVFKGMAVPENASIIPPEEVAPRGAQPTPADIPVKEAAVDTTMEPAAEKRPPNKFPGREKVLHPSRPIVATGQIPSLSKGPRQRPYSQSLGEGLVWIPPNQGTESANHPVGAPSPMKELGVAQ